MHGEALWGQLNNYLTRIDNLLVEREDRLVAQVMHPRGDRIASEGVIRV
jgi:hypothetical protein